jgi:predicted nucleic acid-binding protein
MARRSALPAGPLVVDSSCWLDVFDGGPRTKLYEAAIASPEKLLVPIITVYEVYKYLARVKGVEPATRAAHYMQQGRVIDVDWAVGIAAAGNGLPMADSLIYATAQAFGATLWTQDANFKDLPGVRYFSRP